MAVSKTHPPQVLRQAIDAEAGVLGENKVQEAESKIAELGRDAAEWHLIGHLQSKIRQERLFSFSTSSSPLIHSNLPSGWSVFVMKKAVTIFRSLSRLTSQAKRQRPDFRKVIFQN